MSCSSSVKRTISRSLAFANSSGSIKRAVNISRRSISISSSRLPTSNSSSISTSNPPSPSRNFNTSSSSSANSGLSSTSSSSSPADSLPPLARNNPSLYISLLPSKPTSISTLASRLGLLPSNLDPKIVSRRLESVERACTHPSLVTLWEQTYPNESTSPTTKPKHNAQLSTLGNSILGLIGTEFLHSKYPHLPTRVLKAALSAHVGPSTSADVAAEMGLNTSSANGTLRWDREAQVLGVDKNHGGKSFEKKLTSSQVASEAMKALVAVVFQELGLPAVRTFIQTRFLSRLPTTLTSTNPTASSSHSIISSSSPTPSLAPFLKFSNPKRVLSSTCEKYGKERPQSRLLAETGRLSYSPLFVVGVYSGEVKLGEGNGSSIRMAEFRAAEDALRRLFLTSVPSNLYSLPSTTLDQSLSPFGASFTEGRTSAMDFKAQPLGESEVVYGSKSS